MKPFEESMLFDHPLNSTSLVYEIGGHHGRFALEISRKYGCSIRVFEPCKEFFEILKLQFKENPKVTISNFGVGAETEPASFTWKGDASGMWADGEKKEPCWIYDIADILAKDQSQIDLMQINCEGSEFDILERMIEKDLTHRVNAFQIQFHSVVPNYQARYDAICEGLAKTHNRTFFAPWCWEGWTLK